MIVNSVEADWNHERDRGREREVIAWKKLLDVVVTYVHYDHLAYRLDI